MRDVLRAQQRSSVCDYPPRDGSIVARGGRVARSQGSRGDWRGDAPRGQSAGGTRPSQSPPTDRGDRSSRPNSRPPVRSCFCYNRRLRSDCRDLSPAEREAAHRQRMWSAARSPDSPIPASNNPERFVIAAPWSATSTLRMRPVFGLGMHRRVSLGQHPPTGVDRSWEWLRSAGRGSRHDFRD
jgi:hypothetical protein